MSKKQTSSHPSTTNSRLAHLPVSYFSTVMGLSGFTIALQKTSEVGLAPTSIWPIVLGLSLVVFVLLLGLYVAKLVRYPSQVVAEYHHPIRVNFFPAIAIGFLLQSIAFYPVSFVASNAFWIVGTVLQLLFSIAIVSAWTWRDTIKIEHLNPAWFIPAVGNLLVPVAGIHFAPVDVSWFFFAVGVFYWVLLMTVFFYRSIFHEALPQKLVPTMFILLSPPAIGFVGLLKLTGDISIVAKAFYFIGIFTLLTLLARIRNFIKTPFALTWWAYTFPLAATTIATTAMYSYTSIALYSYLAVGMLIVTSVVVVIVLAYTIRAIAHGEICVPEK